MRAASIGISVCATTSDATIATTIGIATCTRKIDISFFSPNTIGRKTMVVDSVPASTATPTSRTPASVAGTGRPGSSCRCRKMLSVITTELSTSMPIATSMPIMVSTLSVRPRKYIAPSVTSSDAGTARLTISVVGRWRRKASSMKNDSTAPISPALRSSAQRRTDAVCLVGDHQDLDALQLRQLARGVDRRDDAVGHVDDVRLRGLVDVDADRRPAVHAPADRELGRDQLDGRDVADTDAAADHQVAHVVERVELTERTDDEARAVLRDLAGAHREIRRLEQLAQLQHVDTVGGDPRRVDEHANLARLDALELDAGDAFQPLDRMLEEFLERVVLVGEVGVGGQPDDGHRLVRGAEREHQDAVGCRPAAPSGSSRASCAPRTPPSRRRDPS